MPISGSTAPTRNQMKNELPLATADDAGGEPEAECDD